jgi:hypothetical protein
MRNIKSVCWSCSGLTGVRTFFMRTPVGVKPICGTCKKGCMKDAPLVSTKVLREYGR